jgi:alcohol dehydrogenase, propanol-preferring
MQSVRTPEYEDSMTSRYKAVEVSAPGTLRIVEREVTEPGAGQVRIRVEACGICHTDAATVTGVYPGLKLPRVPGHEVVGRIDTLGSGVSRWKIGQRVGVGLIAGEDGVCEPCRRGDTVNCQNPVSSGVTTDGGYAEVMIAEARAISSIPDELTSAEAAPLLCAGVTIYNALRNAGLRGGDLVAVQGIGGLGHLGVQFARQMGFHTVAIGRGREKEKRAKDLGAHVYIDSAAEDAAAVLQRMGGARAILATGTSGDATPQRRLWTMHDQMSVHKWISAIYGQAFMGSSIEMVDRCNSVQSRRAMKTGLRPLPTSVRQYSTLGGTWG